jgi:acetylornithine deacetylase/succinyl-diaminopimelate desuccinylase-like protein
MTLPTEMIARTIEMLRELVRIDTTNPPGGEIAAARYLADLLHPAGIEVEIVESAPGRGNLIARLRGDGSARPLLLMGHLDVVSADPDEWTYPPFGAEIHDGFVWGRGTTDMKQAIAVFAAILLALAGEGRLLKRDVLLLATADEEHGGHLGMGWLVRERPELFDVACALNEGGGGALRVEGRWYYTCQTAEKGVCRTVWTARGPGGHGSQPRADAAPTRLARALARLGDGYLGGEANATLRRALQAIAADRSRVAAERVERLLDQGRYFDAMMAAGFDYEGAQRHRPLFHDTVALTALRAGDPASINVVPPLATAYVDGRILPGQDAQGLLEALRALAGPEVVVELYAGQYSPGLESSPEAPIMAAMRQVLREQVPGAEVIPWMCAGSTDAKHLVPMGVPVYGFVPAGPLPDGVESAGAHAADERLWLEGLPFTLETLYGVVARYCMQE